MTDLKRLADLVRGCDMLDADRDYLATLLRSAAGETVGTLLVEIGYAEACNNRNVYACRLALVAARKERDEKQRAIDEAIIFVEGHLTDENRRKLLAATLRPHATPSQPERAKAERQWRREYFSDRKFWMNWRDDDGERVTLLEETPHCSYEGFVSLDDDTWCLPYFDGDTRDTLPPLPTEPQPAPRPCDCRELVARLTECVEALASRRVFPHFLRDIIRDARGGGA